MISKAINQDITMTPAERDDLAKKLVAAGIDRRTVDAVLNPSISVAQGTSCCHKEGTCGKYFKMSPDAMKALRDAMAKKGIDPKALGGSAAKFF